jgi:hypothetical protein
MNYPKTTLEWGLRRHGHQATHYLMCYTWRGVGQQSIRSTGISITRFNGWYHVSRGTVHIGRELRLNKAKALAEATFILGE